MKRTRLNTVTKNKIQRKRADWYSITGKEYMKSHPSCEVEGCTCDAQDLHHKAGRSGFLKWYPKFFMSVCRKHHTMIEFTHKAWAESKGYRVRLSMSTHWELKDEAMTWAESKGLK